MLALLVSVTDHICALPIANVLEVFRPLPLQPISDQPSFVTGVSIIRGVPTPVVSLSALLLGQKGISEAQRFVSLRIDRRSVALAVDKILGVRILPRESLEKMPPLLSQTHPDLISAIGLLDQSLLVVLEAALLMENVGASTP